GQHGREHRRERQLWGRRTTEGTKDTKGEIGVRRARRETVQGKVREKECDSESLSVAGAFRPALSVESMCSVVQSSFEIRRNKDKLRPQLAGLKPLGVFPEACRPDERTHG